MGASEIEWCDKVWNVTAGCTRVSEGCRNCYAERLSWRFAHSPNAKVRGRFERVVENGRWNRLIELLPDRLGEPLRWRKPARVFVNAMSDLFHPGVPFEFVDRVFAVMALAPQHTFLVLTKRPERMAEFLRSKECPPESGLKRLPIHNVWLGTSVEDQASADERIPHMLRCPAAVRFLSCEPLIDTVELETPGPYRQHVGRSFLLPINALTSGARPISPGIDWVIVGGESGPGARPCNVEWIRSIVQQCRAAHVPVFVKQLGARPVGDDVYCETLGARFEHSKGGDPAEWPKDLRVREWPEVSA